MSQEEEPASPTARLMQAPAFNLSILASYGFMTAIDIVVFKKGLEQTLLKHPRFSSILVANNGKCSWRQTRVDIENHVFTPDLDPDMESSDEFIEDFVSKLSKNSMDLTKPLWEMYILNVKTSNANSTIIFKVHHSIGDGVSLISLVLACAKKMSDPESLPVIPTKKHKGIRADKRGLIKRIFVLVWTMFLIIFNTLIDGILFLATIFCLKDTKTPIRGTQGVDGVSSRRFVHHIVNLDDVKLVKRAMNVSINDVLLGVTEAGLSRYLNKRYEKDTENDAEVIQKTNFLPRNLRLRSAIVFNLRPSPKIEDLAEVMEKAKGLQGMWGNLIGIALLPLTIALQDDPLAYVRRAKASMDRKKLSLVPKCSSMVLKLLIKLFGMKIAAATTSAVFSNTTLTFSNVVGPQEEITLFGHPLSYIAPSVNGFPQALVVHYQSYANKLVICIGVNEHMIPNPHQLCDDFVKSLESIKEAVIKSGLL